MSEPALDVLIREAVATGAQVHCWPTTAHNSGYDASVRYRGGIHHVSINDPDPVSALRRALLENERLCRDLERRYREAPKFGNEPEPLPIVGALPVIDPDFDDVKDCLG